ncbi:rhamnan synthesis F family protein [Neptunicella sp. SCSIO 80796]|uniref:rhamnan synthesis F family protein n=1 Tax=Neptunicella plasticusilytica TaxID=3117012 RepID=UPI003A4DC74F
MPDQNPHNSSLFYLCTGFHRSGTSLVAQTLADNGMHMGNELMGASFSNPLGHVEDLPIVRLHDKIFSINGVDWRYHDHAPLVKPNWLSNYIARYVNEKRAGGMLNGVKDPRAAFFLKDWQLAAGDRLRYIFVYRHWTTACQSLFKRHSRHLVNSIHPLDSNKLNFSFWQQPDLAFDMWRTTNKRILDFYRDHPEKCLLISQEALITKNDSVNHFAKKIGLSSTSFTCQNFRQDLMTDRALESTINMLSAAQRQLLDNLWSELQQQADVACEQIPQVIKDNWFPSPRHFIRKLKSKPHVESTETRFNLAGLSWDESFGFLVRIPPHRFKPALLEELLNRPFTHSQHYQTLAKVAHRAEQYLITRLAKIRAMQTYSQSWKLSDWDLFTDEQPDWMTLTRQQLIKANPFSVLSLSDLTDSDPEMLEWLQQPEHKIIIALEHADKPRLIKRLTATLLYKASNNANFYIRVADIARDKNCLIAAEFSLLLSLRTSQTAMPMRALADLYRSQNRLHTVADCLGDIATLPDSDVEIVAELADVHHALGQQETASRYLQQAMAMEPKNSVVLSTQQHMLLKEQPKQDVASQLSYDFSMYCLPDNEHYENVVGAMREDYQQGKQRDHFYRQNAFIQRRNRTWLGHGLAQLAPRSQINLCSHIYLHWQSLFSSEVLTTELKLDSQTELVSSPIATGSESASLKLAITLEVTNVELLAEMSSFIKQIPYQSDIFIFVASSIFEQINSVFASSGNVRIISMPVDCDFLEKLKYEADTAKDYSLVCRLTTDVQSQPVELENWRLQQLFWLLGSGERIRQFMQAFAENHRLGLLSAPLNTYLINNVLKDVSPNNNLLSKSDSGEVIAPIMGKMFWYRPDALTTSLTEIPLLEPFESGDEINWSLAWLLKQNGFTRAFSHQI